MRRDTDHPCRGRQGAAECSPPSVDRNTLPYCEMHTPRRGGWGEKGPWLPSRSRPSWFASTRNATVWRFEQAVGRGGQDAASGNAHAKAVPFGSGWRSPAGGPGAAGIFADKGVSSGDHRDAATAERIPAAGRGARLPRTLWEPRARRRSCETNPGWCGRKSDPSSEAMSAEAPLPGGEVSRSQVFPPSLEP